MIPLVHSVALKLVTVSTLVSVTVTDLTLVVYAYLLQEQVLLGYVYPDTSCELHSTVSSKRIIAGAAPVLYSPDHCTRPKAVYLLTYIIHTHMYNTL